MKKIISMMLSLCLVWLTLSGCGEIKTNVNNNTEVGGDYEYIPSQPAETAEVDTLAYYVQDYVENNKAARKRYGGCYIDDSGELHVLFTKKAKSRIKNKIKELTAERVIIETCDYTLDELTKIQDYVGDFMSNEKLDAKTAIIADDIREVGVYEQYNRVVVGIKDRTDEKIELFKELISNSDALEFEEAKFYEDN